jgi:hypothetical protein
MKTSVKSAIRWLLLLPGALSSGYLAYLVGGSINRITLAMYLGGSIEGWYNLAAIFMEQMYLGFAVLYVGGKIAPHHKSICIFVLSGFLFLFAIYSTAIVITQPSSVLLSESFSSTAGVIFAIGTMIIGVLNGELDLSES